MHRRGYLFRQLIGLSVVLTLPLLALLAFSVSQDARHAREAAYQAVSNYSASISQDADAVLTETKQYLSFLAERPQVLALDRQHCDPVMEGVVRRRRHFANVVVTELNGTPVCLSVTGPGAVPPTFADTAWFQQATRADAPVLSKPFDAPVAQRRVVAMSAPLRRPGGARLGTLTVLLDLGSIEASWDRWELPAGSRVSLRDQDGTLLVARPAFAASVGREVGAELRAALQANPSGVGVATGLDGVERAFARTPVGQAGWLAVVSVPAEGVFAGYRAQVVRGALVGSAAVLAVIGVAVFMSKRLAAPLISIAQTARAVAAGDLTARANESVPGEFNEVAQEFNAMLDARKQAEAQLRESERRYVDLFSNVEMISLMLDRSGRVTDCNDHLLAIVGCSRDDLIGSHWHARFVPPDGGGAVALFTQAMAGGVLPRHYEHAIVTASGVRRLIRWHSSILRATSGGIVGAASLGEDVTDARNVEARERRQRDFYKALSRTNGAIVRMTSPQALYREICATCVEHGHASIAYISLVRGEWVRPVAWAGPAEGFLDGFEVTLDPSVPEGRGPTAIAVRSGARCVVNDYEADVGTLPWRERAAAIGTKAAAAFPFRRAGQVVGTLSLHMTVGGFFDARLIDLIEEMTGDVSFALDNFDRDLARTAAEQQAQADSARFRTLFQAAPVPIAISSVADRRLLDVNDARCAMSGRSRDELIGRDAFEETEWPDAVARQDFVARLRAEGRVRDFEMQGASETRGLRSYLLQSDLIEFDGQPCVLTITNDITDLRAAQRRLHEREQQLAGLVETAMDAFISIDADRRIRLFNRAATEMFRVAQSEVLGTHVDRFLPARLRPAHEAHVLQFARTGSTARRMGALHTLVGVRADGEEFPIEASISKLGDGPAMLMTVVIRDASELRRADQARVAQAAAESASRAKTEFMSRMSHELRTPLNAVLGFSQLLQSHPGETLTPKQHLQVEHIRKAGWHLLALITDVLDVTRIEAGQVEVERRSVDLHDVLDDACRLTEGMAAQPKVAIFPDYRAGERCRVWADPIRLRQAMINVLSNAIKYNRPGGSVRIAVSREDDITQIEVVDTGMGMTAEQVAHLYEPFNRLGRDRGSIEGTGLGLALTRQLVELMGGRIDVSSELGIGTRVRVGVAAHDGEPTSGFATLSALPGRGDANGAEPAGAVLYIEDNPVNLLLVEQLLSRWPGVEMLQAETGLDGIALARSATPDLVLLDMRLPDMDGVEVLAALRADPQTRDLRVIALSASAMPDEVDAARRAGATDYWTKPLDFEQFVRDVRRLLADGA
jgi:PAS domain S-box-containing protein